MQKMNAEVWQKLKTRIKQRWESLSDEDLDPCRDDFPSLLLNIQHICQEPRSVVLDYIDNLWFEIFVRGTKQTFSLGPQAEQSLNANAQAVTSL